MWTYNIIKKTKTDENTIELIVEFDNGTANFRRTFYVTKGLATRAWLEGEITREVTEFENRKTFNTDIKQGVFTLTNISAPIPTQAEVDKQTFYSKVNLLRKKQILVDLGILLSSDLDVLRNEIKSLYNANYIDATSPL